MKTPMKRKRSAISAGVLASLISASAMANFTCEGKISYLALNPDGSVNVSVGFGTWGICNLSTTSVGNGNVTYTPEACRGWFASMLASQKAGHSLRFYFVSSANTNNGPECTAIGHWVWPNPAAYHMAILNE